MLLDIALIVLLEFGESVRAVVGGCFRSCSVFNSQSGSVDGLTSCLMVRSSNTFIIFGIIGLNLEASACNICQ